MERGRRTHLTNLNRQLACCANGAAPKLPEILTEDPEEKVSVEGVSETPQQEAAMVAQEQADELLSKKMMW